MEKRLKSIALSIVVIAVLFGAIAPVQAVPYVVYGQVFDTDGVNPVDGVSVTVTCIETAESLSATTASGGWYSVTLGNDPTPAPSAGDTIRIVADAGDGRTNTTEVTATGTSPQMVAPLILQTGPSVDSVSPVDGATDAPVNTTINVTFSKPMNTTTAEAAFSLDSVAGTFSWGGGDTTMIFTPDANLAYDTIYTATITIGAEDSEGTPLASEYTWSFATEEDTILPVIHSVTLNPTVVSPGGSILVTVNATDNDAVATVVVAGGATPPAYVVLAQISSDIWEGTITAKSTPDATYWVMVYVQDISGNTASDSSQSYDVVEEWELTIGLVTDYNMISAPLNDTSITNASSLATAIGENCSAISKWNAENQQYVSYVPGVPLNNFDIVGGEGYFVIMTGSATVTFTGMGWTSPITTISLVKNYNMISAPLNDTSIANASSLAAAIGENCSAISKWNAVTQGYASYVPGVPLNNFDIVGGEGYFVIMTGTATVTFEGEPWSS